MTNNFFKIPLQTGDLIRNIDVEKCNINNSIAHYIHLITTTYLGECSFDENFGCSFWNLDFDNLKSANIIKNQIKESLTDALLKLEKRVSNMVVDVKIKQEEIDNNSNGIHVKKRIDITVKGKIKQTNERFDYFEHFYIGPLSY